MRRSICTRCKKITEFIPVDSSLDPINGWKVDSLKTQGGCRDSKADYHTTRCQHCGNISTSDFALD